MISSAHRVAALFVQPDGCYAGMPDVDAWPEARDARTYAGPLPVVAHPPCQLWVNFAALNFARYGGEHNRPGNDGGCFASALANVRRCGGVLEHPAGSNAWSRHALPAPHGPGWHLSAFSGGGRPEWAAEVWQSAYGHKARKRTWLLYVGEKPLNARWERPAGSHQVGWFDRIKPTLSKKEASASPPDFARWLVALAAGSSA